MVFYFRINKLQNSHVDGINKTEMTIINFMESDTRHRSKKELELEQFSSIHFYREGTRDNNVFKLMIC